MDNQLTEKRLEAIIETAITKALQPVNAALQKIEGHLYDDENTSTPGLVQTQRIHGKRIDKLEEDKRVEKKVHTTLGMIGGGAMMALIELLKWFFSNHTK